MASLGHNELTYCDPVMPYGEIDLGQSLDSVNGLLPGSTKPLPLLTNHQGGYA